MRKYYFTNLFSIFTHFLEPACCHKIVKVVKVVDCTQSTLVDYQVQLNLLKMILNLMQITYRMNNYIKNLNCVQDIWNFYNVY